MCRRHYDKWRRANPDKIKPPAHEPGQVCSQEGCEKPANARGYCRHHHAVALDKGIIERVQWRIEPGTVCSVATCERLAKCKGMCNAHYEKLRRDGVKRCAAYKCTSIDLYETTDLCRYHWESLKAGRDIWRESVEPYIRPIGRWWQPSQPTPCQTTDPEAFFPENMAESRLARKLCQQCPEILGCRQFAQEIRPSHGVWAGQSWSDGRVRSAT